MSNDKKVLRAADGGTTEPPKQNTDEKGVFRPLVTEYQELQSEWVVRIMQMSSPAKITCKFMELFTGPMMPTTAVAGRLFKSIDADGWVTVEGGLAEEEYEKLFGKKWWPTIKEANKDYAYLIYDDTQKRDSVSNLFPEYWFYWRNGLKIKFTMTSYSDDSNADVSYEVVAL